MMLILKFLKNRLSKALDPGSQRGGVALQLVLWADLIFFCNSIHHAGFSGRHFLKGLFAGAKTASSLSLLCSRTASTRAPLHQLLLPSHGCLLTAPLVRLLCVPAPVWVPLCPPWPGTAYRTPRRPHSCSALFPGDHRLKPGRITDTRCLCVWCFAGTPSAQEMLSAFFPPSRSVVGHYNRIQLPSQSIPRWFQPLPAIGSHRQWGYAIISDWLEQASIKLWTSKAVYGRTEEFKLHNRQLPCPLTPLPSIQFVVSL